jgi:hypothetical protein
VNPITEGRDRKVLDAVLREVASAGVWVSAHPDVVSSLGTKEVLYRTRTLGWGSDVRLHADVESLRSALLGRLASGPLVLKRARGNGGIGVWKIDLARPGEPPALSSAVRLVHAHDGASESMAIETLLERFAASFADGELLVEQPFLPRVAEGMVRCYVSGLTVVGFSEHLTRGLVAPSSIDATRGGSSLAFEKVMHGPSAPAFRGLREALESDWLPGMQRLLDLGQTSLPAIWDADFLRGPATETGDDRWVLCEINASCVSPFPEHAAEAIARTALERVGAR